MHLLDLLPHRPPMRIVEEVLELVPGKYAKAARTAHPDDFYFKGHFPDEPIVPAVILVEMLAQVGGLAAASHGELGEPKPLRLRLVALGPFKFPDAARPGARMEAHARVARRLGGLYKVEGEVTADGRVVATGSVTLAG